MVALAFALQVLTPGTSQAEDPPDSSVVRQEPALEDAAPLTVGHLLRLLRPGRTEITMKTREGDIGRVTYYGISQSTSPALIIGDSGPVVDTKARRQVPLESVTRLDRWIEGEAHPKAPVLLYGVAVLGAAGGAYWGVSETHSSVAVEILAGLGGAYLSMFLLGHVFHDAIEWPVRMEGARWEQVYP